MNLLFALSMLACTAKEEDPAFGGVGDPLPDINQGSVDTAAGNPNDSGQDTGATPLDEDGPVLENSTCIFDDYPDLGNVIYCESEMFDAQDDALGGTMTLNITGGAFEGDNGQGTYEVEDYGTNCTVCVTDAGVLSFAITDEVDTSMTYTVRWQVTDLRDNRSNEVEVTLGN